MLSDQSKILLRNIGFQEDFFEIIENKQFIIKKEIFKKNFSANAICEEKDLYQKSNYKEAEDYEACFVDLPNNNFNEVEATFYNNETNFGKDEINFQDNNNYKNTSQNFDIFQNISQNHLEQLDLIVKQILNFKKKEKEIGIKAYKSKLKTKFYEIYKQNSLIMKEKSKFKIFHKCNFPGCQRTFSTSGWLKSHFSEHLKDLEQNEFNKLFSKVITKCSKLNTLN